VVSVDSVSTLASGSVASGSSGASIRLGIGKD
jgi:hypothetical protein